MNVANKKLETYNKLAEIIGVLLGDGCLSLKDSGSQNRLKISFNSRDDYEYIFHVSNMLEDTLDIKPILKFRKKENTADLFIFKKKIIEFLVKRVGLKLSPKWNRAIIPSDFMELDLAIYVLRGYFDTDGCLVTTNNNGTVYPRLEMKICPAPMQEQFIRILENLGFRFGIYPLGRGKVRIQLNGKSQLEKWISLIGFSNKKHSRKISRFY